MQKASRLLLIFGLLGVALAMVAPIIEELAAEFEGQVIIGKCDVDENGDMAAEYGIRNIPTVLFFKNGEIVDKQVGAVGKPVFVEKVKKLL